MNVDTGLQNKCLTLDAKLTETAMKILLQPSLGKKWCIFTFNGRVDIYNESNITSELFLLAHL